MAYDNELKGVLFPSKEVASEKHPTHTGKVQINGKEWRLAGWANTSASGQPYMSLKVSEFQPQQDQSDF